MEPLSERSKKTDVIQYKNILYPPHCSCPTQRHTAQWGGELPVLGSIQAEIVLCQECCRADFCFRWDMGLD